LATSGFGPVVSRLTNSIPCADCGAVLLLEQLDDVVADLAGHARWARVGEQQTDLDGFLRTHRRGEGEPERNDAGKCSQRVAEAGTHGCLLVEHL
jgi:hypothetical protein